ncbi:thioredoxin family protein [Spongiimicrobium sp. 3-5]|uniref:thioredoxin family protein n=1 Tax=Spongiimicrobium sp. 3-5 TaxID=3332596 RepID=UPI00397FA0D0
MKKLILLALLIAGTNGICQNKKDILLGNATESDLKAEPFSAWYQPNYDSYTLNEEYLETLKPLLKDVTIKIFMGTWCSDSKKQVPRFYKILSNLDYNKEVVDLVAMSRKKTTPQNLEDGHNIIRIPTVIFFKKGEEINRIVEFPIENLEADMTKILTGKPYLNAYAQ